MRGKLLDAEAPRHLIPLAARITKSVDHIQVRETSIEAFSRHFTEPSLRVG
jgi:hypothetical protein